jgi:hypothetical protein
MGWANIQLHDRAATSFAIALCLGLLEQRYGFRDLEVSLFLFAIVLTVGYAGPCPGILGFVFSSLPNNNRTRSSMHSLPPTARD